jgi:hypothetical protein
MPRNASLRVSMGAFVPRSADAGGSIGVALSGSAQRQIATLTAGVVLALTHAAAADPAPASRVAPAPLVESSLQENLDGWYVHLGPEIAAVRRDDAWDSVAGGSLSIARVHEHATLALVGARVMAARWTAGGGRVGVEGVAAVPLGTMVGISAGPLVDLGDFHHPRIGATGSIWCFAGVVPYVRVGVIEASGAFVEAGISIPLPVWRRR